MRIVHSERKYPARHGEAVILFNIATTKFAIAANSVDEIRNMDGVRALPPGFAYSRYPKVKHIFDREQKMYFVVDANLHFKILPSRGTRLLVLRRSNVAVQVDNIDRMAEITTLHALPRAFEGDERHWYRGLALIGEDVVPVVSPDAFLGKAEIAVLQACAAQLSAAAEATAPKGASA